MEVDPTSFLSEEQIVKFEKDFANWQKWQRYHQYRGIRQSHEVLRTLRTKPNRGWAPKHTCRNYKEGDSTINIHEFLTLIARGMEGTYYKEENYKAFREFDLDGNGLISVAELRELMTDLSQEEVECNISEVDIDGHGQINYGEFVRVFMRLWFCYLVWFLSIDLICFSFFDLELDVFVLLFHLCSPINIFWRFTVLETILLKFICNWNLIAATDPTAFYFQDFIFN